MAREVYRPPLIGQFSLPISCAQKHNASGRRSVRSYVEKTAAVWLLEFATTWDEKPLFPVLSVQQAVKLATGLAYLLEELCKFDLERRYGASTQALLQARIHEQPQPLRPGLAFS